MTLWTTRLSRQAAIILILASALLLTGGCGGRSSPANCNLIGVNVFPTTATADHTLAAPGNQQHFDAFGVAPSGCITQQSNLTTVTWSVSDAVNVSISNVHDATYGTATCTGATTGAATVTATAPNASGVNVAGTAALTCK